MSDENEWQGPTPEEMRKLDEARRLLSDHGYTVSSTAGDRVGPQRVTGDPDFDEILDKCCEILGVKGADYTIGNKDRLHNFRTVANFCDLTPMQSLGVYFYKHVSAIFAFIKNGGQKESEPIEGRIADVINYMLLFYKMVKEQRRERPKAMVDDLVGLAKQTLLKG